MNTIALYNSYNHTKIEKKSDALYQVDKREAVWKSTKSQEACSIPNELLKLTKRHTR